MTASLAAASLVVAGVRAGGQHPGRRGELRRNRVRAQHADPQRRLSSADHRRADLPLYFISGIFLATTLLPGWLLNVAGVFPVRPFQQALLAAYNPYSAGTGLAGRDLLIMAGWGIAGLLVAIRRFRWTPQSS